MPRARRCSCSASRRGARSTYWWKMCRACGWTGGKVTDRPGRHATARGADRLRCILDDRQLVGTRDRGEGREVDALPVEMHGQDRARALGDLALHGIGIEQEIVAPDVGEHRHGAE